MSASTFNELATHVGHNIACVTYGDPVVNVAVECVDCSVVIVDFDAPTPTPHLDDILRRATPEARELIRNLSPDQLAELMDDDDLFNSEPEWTVAEVREYTNPREF